jgi:hypothetical protein
MQEKRQDRFQEAMAKAKKTTSWEKLTPSQKEELIARYLQRHFELSRHQQE